MDFSNFTKEQLVAMLTEQNKPKALTKTLSQKTGVICVWGLGKNPVTLYPSQWDKLLADAESIKQAVDLHRTESERISAANKAAKAAEAAAAQAS
jgi:hypothetical protein